MTRGGELSLASGAFANGGTIPRRHTCDGEDRSPPLAWQGVPPGAVTLALVLDDPDAPAGTWVHWVVFDMPATEAGLVEEASAGRLPKGARQGKNSWGRLTYGGPCPPSGTHRYFFKLYALDASLGLSPGATAADLVEAMKGHVLAEAVLMGRYARR
jgi:Raf kinase inhibitor-like YbhB/YbcL family protein